MKLTKHFKSGASQRCDCPNPPVWGGEVGKEEKGVVAGSGRLTSSTLLRTDKACSRSYAGAGFFRMSWTPSVATVSNCSFIAFKRAVTGVVSIFATFFSLMSVRTFVSTWAHINVHSECKHSFGRWCQQHIYVGAALTISLIPTSMLWTTLSGLLSGSSEFR